MGRRVGRRKPRAGAGGLDTGTHARIGFFQKSAQTTKLPGFRKSLGLARGRLIRNETCLIVGDRQRSSSVEPWKSGGSLVEAGADVANQMIGNTRFLMNTLWWR